MSRVINTNSPTKIRNACRRTIAELLHRLGRQQALDEESKDMLAAMVFALREIHDTAETAAQAWEKRGYWLKAERFLRRWAWAGEMAANVEDVLREEGWDVVPQLMIALFPHFSDIEIKSLTRKPEVWRGAYGRLLAERPQN